MEVAKTCPICFEEFKEGETASPDICEHVFCLNCLQKWAKREKVCPVDRKRFKKIIDLSTSLPILIKPRKRKKQPELYDVTVHCEVCSKSNNEETLILCDCCDLGFHCKCLTPPLHTVPSGVWYCPMCVAVSEKIRSKKGITKDVELVFTDHINSSSCSSESDSSSNESQNIFNAKETKSSENSSKSWKSRKRSNLERNVCDDSNEDSKSSYESNFSYNQNPSTSNNGNDSTYHKKQSEKSLSTEHLRSLRPRQARAAYTCCNISSSEEENVGTEFKNNYLLRNRNHNYLRHTGTVGESSRSSKECFVIEQKENYNLRNKNHSYSKGIALTQNTQELQPSKYLDNVFQEKKQEDFNFSFKTKHSIKKTIPEATITSGEKNTSNELTLSDIVIEHTISLKTANELSKKTVEETETDSMFNVSIVDKNKNLLKPCTTANNSSNIRGVPENLLRSSVGVMSDNKIKELDVSLSKYKSNSPLHGNHDFNSRNDKCNVSNLNSNMQNKHEIPSFSVFEKLEDNNSSKKKYFYINHAVNERSSTNFTNAEKGTPVILPKIIAVDSLSDPISVNTQETKTLSKELLKMQKKKWKTYHLQSRKKCNCSLGLQWCHKHHHGIDSVQIGHHNKHSELYNKLLFATRPFIKKPKWDQLELVILKNVRKKSGIIYRNDNCSSTPKYNPHIYVVNEINNNQSKEVISLKAKNILKLKEDEKGLLNAVMCMPNINELAVRPNGTLFVNWKNHKSSNK